jgi:hypothetical protein
MVPAAILIFSIHGTAAFGLEFETSTSLSAVYEKGSSTKAAAPALSIAAGLSQQIGAGSVYGEMRLFSGAFVGEVLGAEVSLGYGPCLGGVWRPRISAIAALDFGSRLVTEPAATGLPACPMCYLGARLSPLRFELGNYAFSALDATLSLAASEGDPIWRGEVTLLSLERRLGSSLPADSSPRLSTDAGKEGSASKGSPLTLKVNYGLDYALFASLPGGLSCLSLEAGLSYKDVELSLGLVSLAKDAASFTDEWLLSASLAYAPRIGPWNPAIGLGWLYANTGFVSDGYYIYYLDSCSVSTCYLSAKPLRFEIPLSDRLRIDLSCLELRYSPLFPAALVGHSQPSNGIITIDPARVGVSLDL